MIDNMKKTFRLIKYGHQVKGNLILGMASLLFGMVIKFMGFISAGFDIIFLLMPAIFLCQMLYGLDYVKMVSSSALKRFITVYMADFLVDVTVFVVLVVYYVLTELRNRYPGELLVTVYGGSVPRTGHIMFFGGSMAFVLMCYMAGCYKKYWEATIIFCLLMMVYGGCSVLIVDYFQDKDISDEAGILAAFLFYLAGVLVSGVIRRLLYKIPVSCKAVGKRLGELS